MYIRRSIHNSIKDHLKRKEYTIITGPRQCGKTTLLQALAQELQQEGMKVYYITFEDRDILSAINNHPEEVFAFVPRPEKKISIQTNNINRIILFIDEVQYADDPSNFLKYLFDVYSDNLKIVATGSSAFYIDNKFSDSLSGRKRIFELKTLSFEESLLFKGLNNLYKELLEIRRQKHYTSSVQRELMSMLDEYLVFGGYPEVVLESKKEEKNLLLKELRDSFLKKDINEAGISAPDKFYKFLTLLAGQSGSLVNRNELANTIGVDNKTIDKYLQTLLRCFHIELVRPFYSNLRKELTKMPKVYFKDPGMRNIALNRLYDFRDREDQGMLIENYVFNRLQTLYDKENIKFWRTTDNKEIDFIITSSDKNNYAYEVKLRCNNIKLTSVTKFKESYPSYSFEVISYERKDTCKWILKL